MGEDDVAKLLEITKDYPRVRSQYEKLNAEINSLENRKSNLAKEYQQSSNGISNLRKTESQLQLNIKGLQAKQAKLNLQQIRTENFVKHYQDENVEYSKVRKAIQGQIEYVLADKRELLRLAIRSTIELLRLNPEKFLSLHYNRSIIHPENDEDVILVETEQLYEKMLENISNKVVTNLSGNVSPVSTFAQKELHGKAFHPDFVTTKNDSNNTTDDLCNDNGSQLVILYYYYNLL